MYATNYGFLLSHVGLEVEFRSEYTIYSEVSDWRLWIEKTCIGLCLAVLVMLTVFHMLFL